MKARFYLILILLIAFGQSRAQVNYVVTAPPLTGGNSQAGITFNVKAINAITIREVWVVFQSATSYSATVWYHPTDSINGVPTVSTANGWVALGPYSVTATSTSTPTQIVSNLNLPFSAGSVHGFHISVSSGSVTYTTGPSSSGLIFGDANMYINTGTNCGYGGSPPNSAFYIRQFNGKIGYELSGPPCNAPTGLAAGSVTNNSASLTWNAVSGSLGYEYVLDQTSGNPSGSGTATLSTSYSASGLSPNTTYYMHVRNKCGTTTFSSWVTTSFTTQNFVSCYPPATVTTSNMTSSTVTIGWSSVSGSLGYEYKVDQTAGAPSSGWVVSSTNNANITGLTGGASYYAHVRNVCQTTDKSAWVNYQFTMPTCNKPANILISNIQDTSVDLMWSQMPNANGYDYLVDFSNLNPVSGYAHTTAITSHQSNLIPNSKYYLHVRSRCFVSDSSDWKLDSFVTKMVCYAPNVQVNNLGTNNPDAFWNPVPTAIAYEYALTNTPATPAFGNTIYTTNISLTLPEDGKDYYLHVRTKCNSMFTFSAWSSVVLRKGATGINTLQAGIAEIYPNPVNHTLFIKANIYTTYSIVDITGRELLSGSIEKGITSINTNKLASAVYILKLRNEQQEYITRFTKQ